MILTATQSGVVIVPRTTPRSVSDMRNTQAVACIISKMLASHGAYTVRRITPHGARTVMNTMPMGVTGVAIPEISMTTNTDPTLSFAQ